MRKGGSQPVPQSGELSFASRFEEEAMPHINDLFRTATRILGEKARAEDVVQETYLQAWKSFRSFEPGTNCRAWLFKILFHCIHHHRRKYLRFPVMREPNDVIDATLASVPAVPEKLTDEEILAALDKIPGDFRSVVLLVDVEEFAYKEVAEILAIPIGTVMSRLSRGRKLLRVATCGGRRIIRDRRRRGNKAGGMSRLQDAVRKVMPPPELAERIRAAIRAAGTPPKYSWTPVYYAAAIAATLILVVVGSVGYQQGHFRFSDASEAAPISKPSPPVSTM